MKLRKGDKVTLFCVSSVNGVSFNCVVGELVSIKPQQYSTTVFVAEVLVRKWLFLTAEDDMQMKPFFLPLSVWTIMPFDDKAKAHVTKVREACLDLAQVLASTRALHHTR